MNPTHLSDDVLFDLLSSFTTESFEKIMESLKGESDEFEKLEMKSQVVPSASVNTQYQTALEKYQWGVTSYAPREPRVSFFYHNDHKTDKKTDKQTYKDDKKTDKQTKKQTKKPHDPHDRRRVVSYVWVDVSDVVDGSSEKKDEPTTDVASDVNAKGRKGIVYYGGSVYNPTPTVRGILKRLIEKKITSKDQLMNVIKSMKAEYSTPVNYNRNGEKQTAFGRLCQRPVIFETTASTHQQVRDEIKRLMFTRGVFGKRVSNLSEKNVNEKNLSEKNVNEKKKKN
jgi:hypothetical protein